MKKRTWAAAGTAGLLVATTAAVGFTGTASAGTPGPVGTPEASTSTLTWKTTSTGTSVTYSAPKTGQSTQTFSDKNCVFSSGGTQYLTFGVEGPKVGSKAPGVGFKSGTLGVRSGNDSNGTSCAQVNNKSQETLTINLDPTATGGFFGPGQIVSANIDLNLSGNAIVRAEMYKGTELVGRAELQSGFSAPQEPGFPAAQLQICNYASNSGPQSGYNNNCYWTINELTAAEGSQNPDGSYTTGGGYVGPDSTAADKGAYTSIKLIPYIGDFSIQGGQAYPSSGDASAGSAGTVFTIASYSDGTIGCYDGTNASTSQAAPLSDPRAVLTRLQLGDSSQECQLKAYSLDYASNTVTYHQQMVGSQATSQYALVLPRDYPAGTPATASLPAVKVNWEDGSADVTLGYCPAGLITATDAAKYYVPTAYDYTKIGADQTTKTAGTQYACVYRQSVSVNGADGKATAFDYIYFAGDARFAP